MMNILAGAVLLFIFVVSISRFGRVQSVSSDGISITTLLGRQLAVPWNRVRPPVRISRLLWVPIVEIKVTDAGFFSAGSKVAAWVPKHIGREALLESIPNFVEISDWT